MSWLVDTNVVSELSRKKPDAKVSQWMLVHQDDLGLHSDRPSDA